MSEKIRPPLQTRTQAVMAAFKERDDGQVGFGLMWLRETAQGNIVPEQAGDIIAKNLIALLDLYDK